MSNSFIRAYGLHWFRDEIEWKHQSQMLGRQGQRADTLRLVDFWGQTGIYVLHDAYGAYYVGQTERQTLGKRLLDHTKDQHRDRWERFSWFGFNAILSGRTKSGVYRVKTARPKDLLGQTQKTIHDVEALLIMTLGTHRAGNKHSEKFTGAEEWLQVWDHEVDTYLNLAQRQADEGEGPMFR
ncbi:GIY-YIG nuclease family protein [Janibacter anophelis]|uniref:GIY-YIG nuclease family protein n=1 Tax=Janibacter anophelis TaxID=319054 RepID=UPI003F7D3C74